MQDIYEKNGISKRTGYTGEDKDKTVIESEYIRQGKLILSKCGAVKIYLAIVEQVSDKKGANEVHCCLCLQVGHCVCRVL